MSYERRLRSYGVRDEDGQVAWHRITPAQARRLEKKNGRRMSKPVTSLAEPVAEQPEPKRRWTIEDIWRGALRTR